MSISSSVTNKPNMLTTSAAKPFVCYSCRAQAFAFSKNLTKASWSKWRSYQRPTTAPKPSLDIKHIIQNSALYEQNCRDRNYEKHATFPRLISERRNAIVNVRREALGIRRELTAAEERIARLVYGPKTTPTSSKESAQHDRDSTSTESDKSRLIQMAGDLRKRVEEFSEAEKELETQIIGVALKLPNLTSSYTPVGDVAGIITLIESPVADLRTKTRSHVDIGTELDILDFSSANATSGWGFYFLKGLGALLEQALIQYALSVAMKHGWKVVSPPSLVYSHVASDCGFQPRDENDETQIYDIVHPKRDSKKPNRSLAGTAEIPLAGMYANKTIDDASLPIKYVGVSKCYRAEAGARGVQAKGLYRVHEFNKVEMFAWTAPDMVRNDAGDEQDHEMFDIADSNASVSQSAEVFHQMIHVQREILEALKLEYRILEMPTTDLGASASRKVDMEVYFPFRSVRMRKDGTDGLDTEDGEGAYGEVTSTSLCTDYQTRRMATRMRGKDGSLTWPHTLNGTALAVPRVLAAIMETHWDENGKRMWVPEVLRRWMPGERDWIERETYN